MNSKHDCISKVRNELKNADPSLGYVKFDLDNIQDTSLKNGIKMTGQRITFSYIHTMRNGKQVEKTGKSFVTHDYCPFCGKKYR